MTTLFKFANFINTELEEGISAGATEMIIPVAASEELPTLAVDEEIRLVLWDGQSDPEIVGVTSNPQTGVLTIERGKEGTTALSWEAGTQVRCTLTAEIIDAALAAFFDLETVLDANFLPLSGGTLTGRLTLSATPIGSLEAATKGYVDTIGGAFLSVAGGTMVGNINMGGNQVLGLVTPSVDSAAARKKYVDDLISSVQSQITAGAAAHITTGTGAAYVISTGGGLTTPTDGMSFTILPHITNASAATLKVDSMSAIALKVFNANLPASVLEPNYPYTVIYSSAEGGWVIYNQLSSSAFATIAINAVSGTLYAPSGTTMLFLDPAVPAGWTQNASFNDKVLRIVSSGAGAGTGGTWDNATGLTDTLNITTHALTVNEIPVNTTSSSAVDASGGSPDLGSVWTGTKVANAHGHAGSTATITSDSSWRPSYVNAIVGDKT